MGLLITSCLITWNIYGNVDAPINRGFSKIEQWIAGIQSTILLATLEYLLVLFLNRIEIKNPKHFNMKRLTKTMDVLSFMLIGFFFTIFNAVYWL